ncbi:hypothetical protein Q4511_10620 [Paracoccus sp. 1_MG-2023]|uniref:hypothetical protein n=1 Tax=unclassified Paracoccus (in: a-proteobacteria) TaxID=2688777 RepID=UPI001C08BE2E|nr:MULTISPECIES: hypothetical protein [unclassified Paracoccus (in: a-proteobacteria)]MBU2959092.1 hypothetical protein [Paracoccus sp. C2R09]MDO6669376.1 hypothetical protein [Paracoccus sp. 1_MG-2023]
MTYASCYFPLRMGTPLGLIRAFLTAASFVSTGASSPSRDFGVARISVLAGSARAFCFANLMLVSWEFFGSATLPRGVLPYFKVNAFGASVDLDNFIVFGSFPYQGSIGENLPFKRSSSQATEQPNHAYLHQCGMAFLSTRLTHPSRNWR